VPPSDATENRPGPTDRPSPLFFTAMLLSGFAGISYEILYARILADIVGDQFAVSASVLITFLLGIGVGSAAAHRLWRQLWLIEAGIGACGVLAAATSPLLDGLVYASIPLLGSGLAGSIMFCVLLLLLPAFLIGCSIPLFSGYLHLLGRGDAFPRVYAVYNAGAALTAVVIEFLLIRKFGIRGTVLVIAGMNAMVAGVLAWRFGQLARNAPARQPLKLRVAWGDVAALVLASVASAVFQLLALRLAEMLLGPFRETFALVLALILGGIALGSYMVRVGRPPLARVLVLALLGLAFILVGTQKVVFLYAQYHAAAQDISAGPFLLKAALLTALLLVPATAFGATIPALLQQRPDVARASGALLAISSLANVAGFLLMTLVLHRQFEYGMQLLVVCGLTALALVVQAPRQLERWATAVLLMGGLNHAQARIWEEEFLLLGYRAFHDPAAILETQRGFGRPELFRGTQDIFSIIWKDGAPYLFINGYISIFLDSPSEKMVGALSSLAAPRTDKALVLGLGSGGTASAVGLLFDRTDVVEINPVVTANIGRMKKWNFDVEHNPNVHIITDDAVHHMKASQEHYSLVLNTVTTPLYFSSSKLYTREFLEVARRRLTPDGVYTTWMDSRIGDGGAFIILSTLRQVFPHCAMFYAKATYFLLACSAQPVVVRDPGLPGRSPQLDDDFLRNHGLETTWLAHQLLLRDAFVLLEEDQPPVNTLDMPILEFELAGLRNAGVPRLKKRILKHLRWEDLQAALGAAADPGIVVAQARAWLGDDAVYTRRWEKLLRDRVKDFAPRYAQARLDHAQRYANAVDTPQARYKLAARLRDAGRYADAVAQLDVVLRLAPRFNNAHYVMASCLVELGDIPRAKEHFRLELALDPKDQDARERLAALEEP